MNKERPQPESLKSLQILDELSKNGAVTQRELSNGLGIALGLVNSYIKNLVKKGYVTVRAIPPKRYSYYLTPRGFAEKTRLTYDLLNDYTRIYREARTNLKRIFAEIIAEGSRGVVFAGADEVAELAYITLKETEMELLAVLDDKASGTRFFGLEVKPIDKIRDFRYDCVMVASYLRRDAIFDSLLRNGVMEKDIRVIFY